MDSEVELKNNCNVRAAGAESFFKFNGLRIPTLNRQGKGSVASRLARISREIFDNSLGCRRLAMFRGFPVRWPRGAGDSSQKRDETPPVIKKIPAAEFFPNTNRVLRSRAERESTSFPSPRA
jgi:hypothetical protein